MRIEENYSLEKHNTFHLPVKARWFMEYTNEEETIGGLCRHRNRSYVPQRGDRIDRFRNIDTTSSDRAFSS